MFVLIEEKNNRHVLFAMPCRLRIVFSLHSMLLFLEWCECQCVLCHLGYFFCPAVLSLMGGCVGGQTQTCEGGVLTPVLMQKVPIFEHIMPRGKPWNHCWGTWVPEAWSRKSLIPPLDPSCFRRKNWNIESMPQVVWFGMNFKHSVFVRKISPIRSQCELQQEQSCTCFICGLFIFIYPFIIITTIFVQGKLWQNLSFSKVERKTLKVTAFLIFHVILGPSKNNHPSVKHFLQNVPPKGKVLLTTHPTHPQMPRKVENSNFVSVADAVQPEQFENCFMWPFSSTNVGEKKKHSFLPCGHGENCVCFDSRETTVPSRPEGGFTPSTCACTRRVFAFTPAHAKSRGDAACLVWKLPLTGMLPFLHAKTWHLTHRVLRVFLDATRFVCTSFLCVKKT